ncbi:MAG TPA: hypothetical protein VHG70_10720 [Nocardioidaceae bacterium]|nr:hypothetical protein [Nocardioidaceae bacterium]
MKPRTFLNRSTQMYLMHEDLARAHMSARLEEARAERRALVLARAQRAAKRAERKALQARLLLARVV